MNGKKIQPDKQEELILRAEPFLSGKKTPTANADEFYTLLGDFKEFFDNSEISDEQRPLEKVWNQLRLLDEIYVSISLYIGIEESDIEIEFGAKNNHAEHIGLEELQIHDALNMSEYEKFKLRAAPFLLGRKSPIENEDEYITVHDDMIEAMPHPGFRTTLQEVYSDWRPFKKILESIHLLDDIYRAMSQLNIDESEISIRFKYLNHDTEYAWSDDFQMHIDYVFHFAEDKYEPAPKVKSSILGHAKLVYDHPTPTHKEYTVVAGKVECGMLTAKDTVLINGGEYDISRIIHTGYKPYDMKEYAEPGMNIALVLESEHPCYITEGALVTKKQEDTE